VSGVQLTQEEKKTFNGIGKSLSLKMLHYMFGGTFKGKEEEKLLDYLKEYGTFYLKFVHKNAQYEISKNFSEPCYYINNEKIAKTKYAGELKKIFLTENSVVNFKQVFNSFARRFGGGQYNHILTQQSRPLEDYYQKLTNLFLLHVDTSLVIEKFEIKELISKSESALKAIAEYEKKVEVNTNDIEDEIKKIRNKKEQFVIAENYNELKTRADLLTKSLNDFRTQLFELGTMLERKISNLEASENINIDIKEVTAIYEEAKFFFGEKVSRRLEDAQSFHNKLVFARKEKIKLEVDQLEKEIEKIEKTVMKTGSERDELLKYLDSKGALEEYNSLTERIKTLTEQKSDAERYQTTITALKQERADLDIKNTTLHKKSLIYLDKNKSKFDQLETIFRKLVKEFYDTVGISFKIVETQNAKYLFDIESFVPKEGSQGVGEVKIFCYDALLYLTNKDLLGFMAHDGCIFSEMDPRQKASIFKVVLNLVHHEGLQYFININENSLNEVLNNNELFSEDDKDYIKESQILSLTDKDPRTWLFGESFN
jgi:uncharacterized protein YydD (DUF2326 family)